MEKYRTIQGDTWDRIARRFYGDERYLDLLMEGNPECLEYLVFPGRSGASGSGEARIRVHGSAALEEVSNGNEAQKIRDPPYL